MQHNKMLMRIIFLVCLCCCSFVATSTVSKQFSYSCLLKEKPPIDSKFPTIYLNNIQLQVSHRVSHQIISRIFAIFLSEVLDFRKEISFQELDNTSYTWNTTEFFREYTPIMAMNSALSTEPLIDLEVWVSPDQHYETGLIYQGRPVTNDLFRYGLYMLKMHSKNSLYKYQDFAEDTGGSDSLAFEFMVRDTTAKETIIKHLEHLNETFKNHTIFRTEFCNDTIQSCATVLTSHYADMRFINDHIKRFRLKMNVYYLGDNLSRVISLLEKVNNSSTFSASLKPQKYLVLHWNNSEIIDDNFAAITMPRCELYYEEEVNICRYEITPAVTYFNAAAHKSVELFSTLGRFKIPSIHSIYQIYHKYLDKFYQRKLYKTPAIQNITNEIVIDNFDDYYNEIACEWLQTHPEVYNLNDTNEVNSKSWIATKYGAAEIYIVALLPNSNEGREYDGVHTAVAMMQDKLSRDPDIINNGYKLSIKTTQVDCKPDTVMKNFITYYNIRPQVVGVLGPSCSEAIEPIAVITKHYQLSVITYAAEGISIDDRENFPHFYRTIGDTKLYEVVYAKLLKRWNWKRIFALTEDGMKYTQYITNLESRLKEENEKFYFVNKKFARDNDQKKNRDSFRIHLTELRDKNRAKIIIADVHDHNLMKSIMCVAYDLKMTAESGFVWFLPVYVSMKINDTTTKTNATTHVDGCSDENIRKAMQGHFTFSYSSFGKGTDIMQDNITVDDWIEEYLTRRGRENFSHYDDYGGFAYDAIWVYIKAIQQLILDDAAAMSKTSTELRNPYMRYLDGNDTMNRMAQIINSMNFQGVSGRIQFNKGSRVVDVNILQWQGDDFKLVGTYHPKFDNDSWDDGELRIFDESITWLGAGRSRPEDGSESCTFIDIADALNIDCQTLQMTLYISLIFITFTAFITVAFFTWKRKYDKKLDEAAAIMSNYGMVVGLELTEREVARENVVINRKLGEGAFGTVYGGEALISGTDGGWQPVAIKTLKQGSTVENRLDFLAESETMKRFDHKNIVKLLGVCLQKEPLYTIMEYMLYGDLKTYLLARRHLVNERITDESDISPKRMTLMALDVARGLSYLASLGYVHRDIACRNCMINTQRVVKIGDFGMARNTYEREYYKVARNSMLPIRWMAIESFIECNFSHASDIWSYAVMLYEIITLGGYPFQGMSNHQVIDYVKSGGHVKIPENCRPQLRALMTSCFNVDPKKRPGASTIAEFISGFPRMLSPCMDVPKPNLNDEVNLIDDEQDNQEMLELEQQFAENRGRSYTPVGHVDVLRTSTSASALPNHSSSLNDADNFEYLDMKGPRRPNGIYLTDFNPDLTATLPANSIYNPVEPLLRPEISKSNSSLLRYMPMCGKKSNRSSPEDCSNEI